MTYQCTPAKEGITPALYVCPRSIKYQHKKKPESLEPPCRSSWRNTAILAAPLPWLQHPTSLQSSSAMSVYCLQLACGADISTQCCTGPRRCTFPADKRVISSCRGQQHSWPAASRGGHNSQGHWWRYQVTCSTWTHEMGSEKLECTLTGCTAVTENGWKQKPLFVN